MKIKCIKSAGRDLALRTASNQNKKLFMVLQLNRNTDVEAKTAKNI